jgi:putative spermidine/putrescine transport system permease protein
MAAAPDGEVAQMKKVAWLILILCAAYLIVPLLTQFDYSLRMRRDVLSLDAYGSLLNTTASNDGSPPRFYASLLFSSLMAGFTILVSNLLIVPTAYWVHLRLPKFKPVMEFFTVLPFAIPGIVLTFGYLRTYSAPPLALTNTEVGTAILLVGGYTIGVLPYTYRAIDTGLRAIDIRTLTEAARSLGAGWGTIIFRVILPNLRVAVLSASLLTFAVAIGEFTLANFLFPDERAFGSYMAAIGRNRIFEPAALTIISYALVWVCVLAIQRVGRGANQAQVTGIR